MDETGSNNRRAGKHSVRQLSTFDGEKFDGDMGEAMRNLVTETRQQVSAMAEERRRKLSAMTEKERKESGASVNANEIMIAAVNELQQDDQEEEFVELDLGDETEKTFQTENLEGFETTREIKFAENEDTKRKSSVLYTRPKTKKTAFLPFVNDFFKNEEVPKLDRELLGLFLKVATEVVDLASYQDDMVAPLKARILVFLARAAQNVSDAVKAVVVRNKPVDKKERGPGKKMLEKVSKSLKAENYSKSKLKEAANVLKGSSGAISFRRMINQIHGYINFTFLKVFPTDSIANDFDVLMLAGAALVEQLENTVNEVYSQLPFKFKCVEKNELTSATILRNMDDILNNLVLAQLCYENSFHHFLGSTSFVHQANVQGLEQLKSALYKKPALLYSFDYVFNYKYNWCGKTRRSVAEFFPDEPLKQFFSHGRFLNELYGKESLLDKIVRAQAHRPRFLGDLLADHEVILLN